MANTKRSFDKNSPDTIPLTTVDFTHLTRSETSTSYLPDDEADLAERHSFMHQHPPPAMNTPPPTAAADPQNPFNSYPPAFNNYANPTQPMPLPLPQANYAGPHAHGNTDHARNLQPHQSLRSPATTNAPHLRSVPEEQTDSSDDDDDEEVMEIKHVMSKLNTEKISKDLQGTGSAESTDDESDPGQSKRRGLRHYSRQDKKKKKESKQNRAVVFLRKAVTELIQFSLVTRCFFYWLPLAILLFIPLAVGAWAKPNAKLGKASLMWIFVWLEIVWGSLWISRFIAAGLPYIYKFLTSIFIPKMKKYRSVLQAMELPITLVIWALLSLSSFMPVMVQKANAGAKDATMTWQLVINNILVALLISSLIFCAEKLMIHLISVSFHKTRFATRIKDNKQAIHMLSDLLEVACIPFPPFCPEFAEEDLQLQSGKFFRDSANSQSSSGLSRMFASNHNLQKFFGRVNHAASTAAATLGKVARAQALETDEVRVWVGATIADSMNSKRLAGILARRIWMSLVLEGSESLTLEDLIEVLGEDRKQDCEGIFNTLDIDGNGDLTLDEMVSAVMDICHERKSVYKSLKDVDTAIAKLHTVLLFIVMIIIVIIFIGMLAPSASAVLATMGTTILGLSFVFSVTAQEILASCVFLFVKHPLDVGDRVDIAKASYTVKEISLLYTVFVRIGDGAIVQAPNSVLNTLWIDNLSRAGPQTFGINLTLGLPETTLDQIERFKAQVEEFCQTNSRDYLPNPFVACTGLPDLDRVSLACSVTFRNNFSDGGVFSSRRTKLIHRIGSLIHELGLSVPRREDSATDPGLALNISGLPLTEQGEPAEPTFGKRPAAKRALMGFPSVENDGFEEVLNDTEETESPMTVMYEAGNVKREATTATVQSKAYTVGSKASGVSRSMTTGRRRR